MFGDGSLTFREFITREPLPMATVHDAVLEFLRGRRDAVLCGAHAVNAYVDESRMTQDVDILSPRAAELAEELRGWLSQRFQIELRNRAAASGLCHGLFQVRKPQDRHLVDIRAVNGLPQRQLVEKVQVVMPTELIGQKVVSMARRPRTAKQMTDLADIRRLLLTFPELKAGEGPVAARLRASGAPESTLEAWREIAADEILPVDDDEGY